MSVRPRISVLRFRQLSVAIGHPTPTLRLERRGDNLQEHVELDLLVARQERRKPSAGMLEEPRSPDGVTRLPPIAGRCQLKQPPGDSGRIVGAAGDGSPKRVAAAW